MKILNRTKIILLKRSCPSKGLTLMELIVVLLIIFILSTIAIISLTHVKKNACTNIIRYDLKKFFEAEQIFYGEHDVCKGGIGDIISHDSSVLSTFNIKDFSPSRNTSITIINDDPFTVVGRNGGVKLTFEWNFEKGTITERR